MSDSPSPDAPYEHGFEVHGVRVAVGASDPDVLARLVGLLPTGVTACAPEAVERRFALLREEGSGWRYDRGNGPGSVITDLELAIGVLDSELRLYVAATAPQRIFIHAAAVAHRGHAIVIPGHTFSGKSTLVAALVREGAVYYSDEYAILDGLGLVHPYARPISVRVPDRWPATERPVESFGGTAGEEPVPVGLIVVTSYRPDASWSPERRSEGQGMLTLLSHALPVRERPAEALAAARRAASDALVLEGERGEAEATARAILESAAEAFANRPGPGR